MALDDGITRIQNKLGEAYLWKDDISNTNNNKVSHSLTFLLFSFHRSLTIHV